MRAFTFLTSLALTVALGGCGVTPPETVGIDITGSPGSVIEGYYIRDGRRIQLQASTPVTVEGTGVTQVAVRKTSAMDAVTVAAKWKDGSMSTSMPAGNGDGVIIDLAGGGTTSVIPADASLAPPGNAIMVLAPYRYNGTWVFDDPAVGLKREAFVAGVPEMIDEIVKDIPDARQNGFRLTFSAKPFPGYEHQLKWVRSESGGNVYRMDDPAMEGWLCPAMFRYFPKPPKRLYVRADPKSS